jgi:hypothetical protein
MLTDSAATFVSPKALVDESRMTRLDQRGNDLSLRP